MKLLTQMIVQAKEAHKKPIIAEIKRFTPATSTVVDLRSARELSQIYERAGAVGISVVTEKDNFAGQPEVDVPEILNTTKLPLVIKDFITNKNQVDFYAHLIPTANRPRVSLLLIAHHLTPVQIEMLSQYIAKLGMSVLFETRSDSDLKVLPSITNYVVGINNRDIDQLEKDVEKLKVNTDLIDHYRERIGERVIVSSSGHKTVNDVARSLQAGADCVLVGSAFMNAPDIEKQVVSFVEGKVESV